MGSGANGDVGVPIVHKGRPTPDAGADAPGRRRGETRVEWRFDETSPDRSMAGAGRPWRGAARMRATQPADCRFLPDYVPKPLASRVLPR